MQTPGTPPVPHVGGTILPPGSTQVFIGNQPAACVGDMAVCIGAPAASIMMGSTTVKIGGKPAARVGDPTEHGGKITSGCPTVSIGG